MKFIYALSALAALAAATPLDKRAGGPIAVPISPNCTVTEPLPHADRVCGAGNVCGVGKISGYNVTEAFASQHLIYYAYFEPYLSKKKQWEMCIEQCFGYGIVGDCKAALLAYNAPTPPGYFGTKGGDLRLGCLLYGDYLTPLDFEPAPAGLYVNETAGNIYCPPGTTRPPQ